MNEQQVRTWFGERGYPIADDSKIKFAILEKWLFLHDPNESPDKVISYPLDTLHCEPYAGWSVKGFDWSEDHLKTLVKLENPFPYILKAVDGDVVGMGGNDTIKLENHADNMPLIKDWLRNELEMSFFTAIDCHKDPDWLRLLNKKHEIGNALIECCVFRNKFDKRTSWVFLSDPDDVVEL